MTASRIAMIPARGGSKRIPRKNVRIFCGKPMIQWSIEAALASKCFDRVVVSTDDDEIAAVAVKAGAEVPFVRPADLADDLTGINPVMRHGLRSLALEGERIDLACCLFATAPFLEPADIKRGLSMIESDLLDYALAVTSYAFPIQRALSLCPSNGISMFYPEFFHTRSQDLEDAWHDAGQFCWGTYEAWTAERPVFLANSTAVKLPRHRVQDIDTEEDWRRAELMFQALCEIDTEPAEQTVDDEPR